MAGEFPENTISPAKAFNYVFTEKIKRSSWYSITLVKEDEILKHVKELEEEYGAINIDMTDGSYTEIEVKDDSEMTVVKSED